ncbi:hypothetical protein JZ751_027074 [Albula glossodonta]|uniref:Zinc finger protein ZFPM1 n=1 Tax=Albula glossodonta TaxID=121402 RepID=A0A8T2NCC9_9TELE|nr:hypothetical protein JZ751_027074 [Albula glossodonta]
MEDEEQHGEGFDLALVSKKTDIWLKKLPVTSSHTAANCIKYSQGEELYCKVTKAVRMGDCLLTQLPGSEAMETHDVPVKENGHKPLCPEIQLLPQQAGMAAILATATVNKDIFPCKACGIWFRSERNLQAHLMYYCASRKQGSASPPPEGPSEHVCPVIHCNKSCPSASALEIHMHRHSAFTTKANCERHMKLHIATESGMCHGCGFVSGCRDTLYSHLVTCHMVCRSDLKDEGTSPPPSMPQQPLATGVSLECGVMLQCQVCGFAADSPTLLHKHVQTHLEVRNPAPHQSPSSSDSPEPVRMALPNSTSPGGKEAPAEPDEDSALGIPPLVQVKKELRTDPKDEGSPSQSPSPRDWPSEQVKEEFPSTACCSKPEVQGVGVAGPPSQASEVLGTMSELVHTSLRQEHTPVPPAHRGATCVECDVTFNNIDNFYTHKRLYCSTRHQQGDAPIDSPKVWEDAESSTPSMGLSSSPAAAAQCSNSETQPGSTAGDAKAVEVKTEETELKEASFLEGESDGQKGEVSEASQSPASSAEDVDDPNTTFCQACNIHFSRHDNYTAHKRFYCASRHQPSNQRVHASNASFLPQPVRSRKRKKMYEIHMARSHALACSDQDAEEDSPIDLCKRPRPHEPAPHTLPVPSLGDYHKCAACSISFNSLENYLAHKTYYCPTPLQQNPIQPLSKVYISVSPKPGPPDHTDLPTAGMLSPAISPSGCEREASPHPIPLALTPVACPYCPPGEAVTDDLKEHFRTAHGFLQTQQPHRPPHGRVSPGQSEPSQRSETPPCRYSPGMKIHPETNGHASPSSPQINGSHCLAPPTPPSGTAPKTTPLSLSPELMKEVGPKVIQSMTHLAQANVSAKVVLLSPLQNGTSRYCRLCNIRFSSLSTFIAHKKYYCSSHSAEHIK